MNAVVTADRELSYRPPASLDQNGGNYNEPFYQSLQVHRHLQQDKHVTDATQYEQSDDRPQWP